MSRSSNKPGRAASDIVAELVPEVIRKFPWPKSMRWGSSRLRWVRPLHSILCVLDGEVVPFEVEGIASGGVTFGHRRALDPGAARRAAARRNASSDYRRSLEAANVIVARSRRVETILAGAQKLAAKEKLALVEDHGLVDENAGLAEWPVVLSGSFDESFLDVPQEVLITSMKAHQKCFSLREPSSGKLANRFLMVANLAAADGGNTIIAGNERVICARLSDAKFFWENDKARGLEAMLPKLDEITFHEKLGTQGERVRRLMKLARELAPLVGADPDKAERAARAVQGRSGFGDGRRISQSCKGSLGAISRWSTAKMPRSPTRSPSTISPQGRATSCRRNQFRSRSRWRISSICSSASGRSTKNRLEAKTHMRCGVPRLASIRTYIGK